MAKLTDAKREELIQAAVAARKHAYAPFSEFHVGSAVLDAEGRVFSGVNVENSSYGLTICGERSAAVSAVTAGARELVAVAIVTDGAAGPCGACRQFLYEFEPEAASMTVLLVEASSGKVRDETTLAELLPKGFRLRRP